MKVTELIAILSKLSSNPEVRTEGCDCFGDSAFVAIDCQTGELLIARSDAYISKHLDEYLVIKP